MKKGEMKMMIMRLKMENSALIFCLVAIGLVYCSNLVGAQYVLSSAASQCPPEGLHSYAHEENCDQYYLCTNGTLTLEDCPNGLLYSVNGAIYQFCAHQYGVNCEGRKQPGPISSPGCPWQFGYFPEDSNPCNIQYSECAWGIPERKLCQPKGLIYDDRIKGCNWPDKVGCKSEDIVGFKCPDEDKANPYYPYPRYYYNQNTVVTCVNGQPRLNYCGEDEYVDSGSLACTEYEPKKKKFVI